jgi:glyoxylate carboligase
VRLDKEDFQAVAIESIAKPVAAALPDAPTALAADG